MTTEKGLDTQHKKPLWEVILPYLGIIIILIGVILLLASALSGNYPTVSMVLRDIGMAVVPVGVIILVFERVLRKHYVDTVRQVVGAEILRATKDPQLAEFLVSDVVDRIIRSRQAIDIETLRTIDVMKRIGLERILTRTELETSDIAFARAVEVLKNEQDKQFLIVGKSLEFVSRQIDTVVEGLESGVDFKLSLIEPAPEPWDIEYVKKVREKAQYSVNRLKELLKNPDPRWTGRLELRKTKYLVENSFSSFGRQGKRISVLDFDLGEDIRLQCSLVFVHKLNEKNLAASIYMLNEDKFNKGHFVLAYPIRYNYAYIYGLRQGKLIFVRKHGTNTWELPGGRIEPGETPGETAKREFLEETGYEVEILEPIETGETDKLAFIGRVKGGQANSIDTKEIKEIEFLDRLPSKELLSFPDTGYEKVLSMLRDRFHLYP